MAAVFASPHSGARYSDEFVASSRLDPVTLRRSEDSFVDELMIGAVGRGYPLMRAHFPRCYIDVNREPYELDPRMFEGRLPSFANTRSMRVAGGLGTVARVVGDAQEIYGQRIPVDDAIRRIEANPEQFQVIYKNIRHAITRRFPYGVFYRIQKTSVVVSAVVHLERSDVHWKGKSDKPEEPG